MSEKYIKFLTNSLIPFMPVVAFDNSRKRLVHLYENIELDVSNFQSDVSQYLTRNDSLSGNLVTIHKLQDERITFKGAVAGLEVTVVTDYVPWRLHQQFKTLTYEQALFMFDGALRGFRELLHRLKSPFIVDKKMIGVDAYGEVKVWWNEHFFQNKMIYNLTTDVKLRDMIESLINCLTFKMSEVDASIFRASLLLEKEITFSSMENKIREMSKGLNLFIIGRNMISENHEISSVLERAKELKSVAQESAVTFSGVGGIKKSTIISLEITPAKDLYDGQLVTKRIYKDGTSPQESQKMNVIKNDIEKLRFNKNEKQFHSPLKHAKSLSNIVSIKKGLFGDDSIPEV